MIDWNEIHRNWVMIFVVVMLFIGCVAMTWACGQYMHAAQVAGYIPTLTTPDSGMCLLGSRC